MKLFWIILISLAYACADLPRFASTRSAKVNMHVGPGSNYPVKFLYVRKNLPLEIIAEHESWRQVRDIDGTVGWIHKSLLSGGRYILIMSANNLNMYASNNQQIVAVLAPLVLAKLIKCSGDKCCIKVKPPNSRNISGWVDSKYIWGVHSNDKK